MKEPIPVLVTIDGEQRLQYADPGTYLYRILSKPGQRAFTKTKRGVRYERLVGE